MESYKSSIPAYVKFDSSNPSSLTEIGLDFAAVQEIVLGPPDAVGPPGIMDCPPWAVNFITREYKATQLSFHALSGGDVVIPNPVGGMAAICVDSFTPEGLDSAKRCYFIFEGGGTIFGLVLGRLYGRVTHIYVPSADCIIYDLDQGYAPTAYVTFKQYLQKTENLQKTEKSQFTYGASRERRIALVHMEHNYAHQAMNCLSGLQRLIDIGWAPDLDEIWLSGTEFFGPTEELFPELSSKIRHISCVEATKSLRSDKPMLIPLGSNLLSARLRGRILQRAFEVYPSDKSSRDVSPVLAVTLRAENRRCTNLPESIGEICRALLVDFPDLRIVLDGWVIPEMAVAQAYKDILAREAVLAESIIAQLPRQMQVDNITGMPLLRSISQLRHTDAYIAHVGTLQNKISWFTEARGVVHGPQTVLGSWDASLYSCEIGFPPMFMEKFHVRDLIVDHPRGQSVYDYEILDVGPIIQTLRAILGSGHRPYYQSENSPTI